MQNDFIEIVTHGVNGCADPEPKPGDDPKTPPSKDPKKDDPAPPIDISKMSLEEIAKANPELADVLKKQKEIEDAKAADERKKAEEKGEYQKIIDNLEREKADLVKKVSDRDEIVEKYTGTVNNILGDLEKQIPDDRKSLIPDGSPRNKLEYVMKNAKWLGLTGTPGVKDSPAPNGDTPAPNDEQKLITEITELDKKSKDGTITATEKEILFEKAKALKAIRNKK